MFRTLLRTGIFSLRVQGMSDFFATGWGTIRGLSTTTAANSNRIRALFSGPQMARSTTLLILTWGGFFTEGLYLILYSPTL